MARYSDTLLDHARHPHNYGRDPSANAVGHANLDGRPPEMDIYLRIDKDRIRSAQFHAAGCGVTIAAGSILTDMLHGRTLQECSALSKAQVDENLEGVPPDKMFCVDVAIAALEDALKKVGRQQEPEEFARLQ